MAFDHVGFYNSAGKAEGVTEVGILDSIGWAEI